MDKPGQTYVLFDSTHAYFGTHRNTLSLIASFLMTSLVRHLLFFMHSYDSFTLLPRDRIYIFIYIFLPKSPPTSAPPHIVEALFPFLALNAGVLQAVCSFNLCCPADALLIFHAVNLSFRGASCLYTCRCPLLTPDRCLNLDWDHLEYYCRDVFPQLALSLHFFI